MSESTAILQSSNCSSEKSRKSNNFRCSIVNNSKVSQQISNKLSVTMTKGTALMEKNNKIEKNSNIIISSAGISRSCRRSLVETKNRKGKFKSSVDECGNNGERNQTSLDSFEFTCANFVREASSVPRGKRERKFTLLTPLTSGLKRNVKHKMPSISMGATSLNMTSNRVWSVPVNIGDISSNKGTSVSTCRSWISGRGKGGTVAQSTKKSQREISTPVKSSSCKMPYVEISSDDMQEKEIDDMSEGTVEVDLSLARTPIVSGRKRSGSVFDHSLLESLTTAATTSLNPLFGVSSSVIPTPDDGNMTITGSQYACRPVVDGKNSVVSSSTLESVVIPCSSSLVSDSEAFLNTTVTTVTVDVSSLSCPSASLTITNDSISAPTIANVSTIRRNCSNATTSDVDIVDTTTQSCSSSLVPLTLQVSTIKSAVHSSTGSMCGYMPSVSAAINSWTEPPLPVDTKLYAPLFSSDVASSSLSSVGDQYTSLGSKSSKLVALVNNSAEEISDLNTETVILAQRKTERSERFHVTDNVWALRIDCFEQCTRRGVNRTPSPSKERILNLADGLSDVGEICCSVSPELTFSGVARSESLQEALQRDDHHMVLRVCDAKTGHFTGNSRVFSNMANYGFCDYELPLIFAARNCSASVVNALLRCHANVNGINELEQNALHVVALRYANIQFGSHSRNAAYRTLYAAHKSSCNPGQHRQHSSRLKFHHSPQLNAPKKSDASTNNDECGIMSVKSSIFSPSINNGNMLVPFPLLENRECDGSMCNNNSRNVNKCEILKNSIKRYYTQNSCKSKTNDINSDSDNGSCRTRIICCKRNDEIGNSKNMNTRKNNLNKEGKSLSVSKAREDGTVGNVKNGKVDSCTFRYGRLMPKELILLRNLMRISEILVCHGIDVNKRDIFHKTPLHYARRLRFYALVQFLNRNEACIENS